MKTTSKFKLLVCGLLIFLMIGLIFTVIPKKSEANLSLNDSFPEVLNSSDFNFNELPFINSTPILSIINATTPVHKMYTITKNYVPSGQMLPTFHTASCLLALSVHFLYN